jgi:hypothetical protein
MMRNNFDLLEHVFLVGGPGWDGLPWLSLDEIKIGYDRPTLASDLNGLVRLGYLENSAGKYRISKRGIDCLLDICAETARSMFANEGVRI